jgi:phage tail-like protein
MAGDVQNNIWPLPKFKFNVTFAVAQITIQFAEISGLDAEAQGIEYRHGNSPNNFNIKMPGLQKFNNVTLKRGVFVGNNEFFTWFSSIVANTVARDTVTIQLWNEKNAVTMQWTLNNAWPTKVTSTDMKSDANEAAIESIEISFESLVIANQNNT